jgi:hypothetical protein
MEAIEGQRGAVYVLETDLQRARSRVKEFRSSEISWRNNWNRREYIRVAELSRRNTAKCARHIAHSQ